jgi:hypothetical protein
MSKRSAGGQQEANDQKAGRSYHPRFHRFFLDVSQMGIEGGEELPSRIVLILPMVANG